MTPMLSVILRQLDQISALVRSHVWRGNALVGGIPFAGHGAHNDSTDPVVLADFSMRLR